MNKLPLAAILLLTACQTRNGVVEQQTGPVRARNGGSAEVLIQACPGATSMPATEAALHRMVIDLQQAGVLASANDDGSAKLTIDLCPAPP
jgi:hypothetical protein